MNRYFDVLVPILLDSVMLLAAVAAILGLVTSLWMLLSPTSFARLEEIASRSFSLRRSMRPLEISRNIDRHIYRHHKLFGLVVILASTFTLYNLLFSLETGRLASLIGHQFPAPIAGWLIEAINLFLIAGNLFAIVIGLMIYVRPSALKSFESRANQWVSLREQTSWLETRFDFPDKLAKTQPRIMGVVLLLFSVYLMSLASIS